MGYPNTALILAATKGTRMVPTSRYLPKCLLPVGGFPIIVHQIMEMEKSGVTKAHICLENTLGPMVQRSLEKGYDGGIELSFSYESNLRGIGYTTYINRSRVGKDFILALADEYSTSHSLINSAGTMCGDFLIGVAEYANQSDICSGCNVLFDDTTLDVIDLIEKPESDAILGRWCWTGFAKVNEAIFSIIHEQIARNLEGEIDLTVPLREAIARGHSVMAVKEPGININVTTLSDYKKACQLAET